jgi:hypothetical protein
MNSPQVNAVISIALGLCVAALLNQPREEAPAPVESFQPGGGCSATVSAGQVLTEDDVRRAVAAEIANLPEPPPPVVIPTTPIPIKVPEPKPIDYNTLAEYVIKLWEQQNPPPIDVPDLDPLLIPNQSVESDIVQQKINRVLDKLKYRPRYFDNIADGIAAAEGKPWLLFLLTDKESTVADRLLLCPAADDMVVVELYAENPYLNKTYREEMSDHTWPSVTLYKNRRELETLDINNLPRSLTQAKEKYR